MNIHLHMSPVRLALLIGLAVELMGCRTLQVRSVPTAQAVATSAAPALAQTVATMSTSTSTPEPASPTPLPTSTPTDIAPTTTPVLTLSPTVITTATSALPRTTRRPRPTRTARPTAEMVVIPAPIPEPALATPIYPTYFPDWRGEYFNNPNLADAPVLVRNDTVVDFNWGAAAPDWRVSLENFSVRWTRQLYFDNAIYRFTLRMDDGARLYVDGTLVLNNWQDGSDRTATIDLGMASGSHTLQVEYYERTGQALIHLGIDRLQTSQPQITEWRGEYFANATLSGNPLLVRNDSAINFDWGNGAPDGLIPNDNFSVRWSRRLGFGSGTYRFVVTVDDGVRLWVDGNLIIDSWYDSSQHSLSADYAMSQGDHDIRIDYYEHGGGANAHLTISLLPAPTPTVITPMPMPPPPLPNPVPLPIPGEEPTATPVP